MGKQLSYKRAYLEKHGYLPDPEADLYRDLQEKQIRDLLLLPAMLWAGITVGTEQEGWDLSPEIGLHLESAAEVIVRTRSSVEISKIAHRVIGDASTVLNQCGAATAKEATLAAAFFILELVDKGAIADPTSRAILAALAIAEEAKQGTGDAEARELEWTYTETKIGKFVNAIRTKSEFLGYF